MADVNTALRSISSFFAQNTGSLQSLSTKQELLSVLLENEQMRLLVWLYPLDHEKRHFFPTGNSGKEPPDVRFYFAMILSIILVADFTS